MLQHIISYEAMSNCSKTFIVLGSSRKSMIDIDVLTCFQIDESSQLPFKFKEPNFYNITPF